jgi:hypothetical protein
MVENVAGSPFEGADRSLLIGSPLARSIDHGTFTAGSGSVGRGTNRCDGAITAAQTVKAAATNKTISRMPFCLA